MKVLNFDQRPRLQRRSEAIEEFLGGLDQFGRQLALGIFLELQVLEFELAEQNKNIGQETEETKAKYLKHMGLIEDFFKNQYGRKYKSKWVEFRKEYA